MMAEVKRLYMASSAAKAAGAEEGGAEVSVAYCGLWRPVVLTELVVQDESGISCREEMAGEIKSEMRARQQGPGGGLSELDKLDMEMMLSCLEPSSSSKRKVA